MIIILNKPVGWTSFDVCKKVKNITKEKKVGHGGTLDPFASGVLVIGTGKDTKKLKFVSDEKKSYDSCMSPPPLGAIWGFKRAIFAHFMA